VNRNVSDLFAVVTMVASLGVRAQVTTLDYQGAFGGSATYLPNGYVPPPNNAS
jgi:hypothetical protein